MSRLGLQGDGINPDLAAAWFRLLSHCLIDNHDHRRHPLVARVAPSVPQHFTLALRCLVRQEEELVRASITFIRGALVTPPPLTPNLKVWIASQGSRNRITHLGVHPPS